MKKQTLKRRIVGASLSVVLAGSPLYAAEQGPPPEPGDRVRVTESGETTGPRIGTWEGLRNEHLLVKADDRSHRIPLSAVRRLEVSRGRKASVTGGVLGTVVGGAMGSVAMGCLANKDDYGVACGGQDDTKFLIGALVGGLAGGVLGALIGRGERWEGVDVDRLDPSGDGPSGP
jgi:hypothetical protein